MEQGSLFFSKGWQAKRKIKINAVRKKMMAGFFIFENLGNYFKILCFSLSMPLEKSAGVIIFRKEDNEVKYLLLYRKAHHHYSEQWEFPKGLVEKESEEKTARREAREEAGIKELNLFDFKEKVNYFYKKENLIIKKEVVYFLAETKQKEVEISEEHDDYKWAGLDEALKLLKQKNLKEILIKANEFIFKFVI